jgi:hypothetical protein
VVDVRERAIIPKKNERYVFVTVRILAEKCAREPYEKLKKTDKTRCPCVQ